MALTPKILNRVFRFKNNGQEIELPDPNPAMTPDQVMYFYANQYPALTTASVSGSEFRDDKLVYTFTTTLGTKG